jgi:2-aminobenzoate-CoA ligase
LEAERVTLAAPVKEPSGYTDTFAADNLPPRDQWPVFLIGHPAFAYPSRLNYVSAFLDRRVEEGQGDRPCLIDDAQSLSYAKVQREVNRVCNVLVNRLGLKTGNRVLLRSANTIPMAIAYLAVLKAGGIVVATMPLLRAKEIAYPLNKAKIRLALCHHEARIRTRGRSLQSARRRGL